MRNTISMSQPKSKSIISAIWSLLLKQQKYQSAQLILAMLALSAIELVGVGAIFPYVKILSQPGLIHSNATLQRIYLLLHFSSDHRFMIFLGLCIIGVILVKGVLSLTNIIIQSKFTTSFSRSLSHRCLQCFLYTPYEQTTDLNSSTYAKHLLVDTNYTASVLKQTLTILTDGLILITLTTLMISIDPGLVISVTVVIAACMTLISRYSKHAITRISRENELLSRHIHQYATESLQGKKEINSHHSESFFIERFMTPVRALNQKNILFETISATPGIALNTIAFAVLVLIMLYLLATHGNLISILPILSVMALSVQRLLPVSVRIYNAIGLLRRYHASVFIIHDIIKSTPSKQILSANFHYSSIHFKHRLTLQNVSYQYPNSRLNALNDISLTIEKNSSLGIVGLSGAGKSTLVNVILGLLTIKQGKIILDDDDISQDTSALSSLIGYVPQKIFLLDDTLMTNIAFGIEQNNIDLDKLNAAIAAAQLNQFISELPDGLNTRVGEHGMRLSGGQCQRVGIARALYRDPDILIMDEATNALDSITENDFNAALQQLSKIKTLIIIAHRASSIRLCDKLVVIDAGQCLAQGSFNELYQTNNQFRALFGNQINAFEPIDTV